METLNENAYSFLLLWHTEILLISRLQKGEHMIQGQGEDRGKAKIRTRVSWHLVNSPLCILCEPGTCFRWGMMTELRMEKADGCLQSSHGVPKMKKKIHCL